MVGTLNPDVRTISVFTREGVIVRSSGGFVDRGGGQVVQELVGQLDGPQVPPLDLAGEGDVVEAAEVRQFLLADAAPPGGVQLADEFGPEGDGQPAVLAGAPDFEVADAL